MRRLKRGSISSEMLMCAGCVNNILLFPLGARCIDTIDVYMAHVCFNVCCSDCGNVTWVAGVVEDSGLFVLKYVCSTHVVSMCDCAYYVVG